MHKRTCSKWREELTKLCEIAKTQPQDAYAAFTSGYKHTFSYFMRTINCISHFMSPVEKVIKEKLIPALFDGFPLSEKFRKLLALHCKLGEMGIIDPTENANDEYNNSRELTGQLTSSIKQQEYRYTVSDKNSKSCKSSIKKKRKDKHLNILTSLREQMSSKYRRLNDIAQEQGSSSWLTILPIKQLGFSLSKAEFWDAVYLRYGLPLKRLPSHCGCSKVYTVQHALSCKKGGFVTLSHNKLRDNIAEMLMDVTNDVRIEPILSPLTGEEQSVDGNVSVEARADISARTFWCRGQK